MRLFVMVLSLTLVCGAAAVAADSTCPSPCPTATPPCPTPCPTPTCPSPAPVAAMRMQTVDTCLMCTFGLTEQQICSLRNQGYSNRDIATAAAIAKKACVSIDDVIASYCECKDWNSVATKYNLCLADLQAMISQCICPQPSGAGPCDCYAIYTKTGRVLLTRDEALRYYVMGYDWMDVALATNVALQTGYPVLLTLMDIRRGVIYEDIARMQGVPFDVAFNFTNYPFPRTSVYSAKVEAKNIDKFAKYQVATQPGYSPMITLPALRPAY